MNTAVTETVSVIDWSQDSDGVVTLTLDDPRSSANTDGPDFRASLAAAVDRLRVERETVTGVIVTSGKKSFFAGGDLQRMLDVGPETVGEFRDHMVELKSLLRTLETFGLPVVAAINGSALGGGFEIALACHRRIALRDRSLRVGLPEVTFGLLPGAGGLTRSVRLLGLKVAVDSLLLDGAHLDVEKALALGAVDELADTPDELLAGAKAWILANPESSQPWDRKGYQIPGPPSVAVAAELTLGIHRRIKGAPLPAPRAIVAAAVEGSHVSFDAASDIETRYFLELILSTAAKNLIRSTFFDLRSVRRGTARPDVPATEPIERLGIVGAGLMGAGLAYQAAAAGVDVLLMDVSVEAAERGKDYARRIVDKSLAKGSISAADAEALLERIQVVTEDHQLKGAQAVIEAIVEDPDVKRALFARIEPHVEGALLASNTSTLPITELADGVMRREDFIGMHFFSPVERMPLLEVIVGGDTSPETVGRAFDLGRQLGKTPIIVNDARGFFTSRVISARLDEALALIGEGHAASSIERASTMAGYPLGILQFLDEVTIKLPRKVRDEARRAAEQSGTPWVVHPAEPVMERLIDELGRVGRSTSAGFYDYVDGRRAGLWPGLAEHFGRPETAGRPIDELTERLLFAEAIEATRCFDEGVITSIPDANVGSLIGIGFPGWTGGVMQFVASYPGGIEGFVRRASELADAHGERFRTPASLPDIINRAS